MRDTQKTLESLQEELKACEDLETVKAQIKEIMSKISKLKTEVGTEKMAED